MASESVDKWSRRVSCSSASRSLSLPGAVVEDLPEDEVEVILKHLEK
jgi:hypothetical protein